ncbi:hypothetical protein WJX75_002226 [Coccomyxa subellipsoidea]|uniref:Uncharacterized protein n=1 Tax=Coccomyxa subellipsoidea TaxID=248742 RepID=A0ABR2YVH3_9CHLO
MMEFKGREHEKQYQTFFAKQHLTWDLLVYLIGLCMSTPVMINFWKNSHIRSPLWYAAFLTIFIMGKVIPAVMITRYGGVYTQHRTAVVLATRLLEFYITHAYLSFWADSSDQDVFAEWIVLACVFANISISTAAWGFLLPVPNRWWSIIQILDLGRHFLCHTTRLRQMEQGMHHLAPFMGNENNLIGKLGVPPLSEPNGLLLFWIVMEVFGAFLLPFLLTYRMQLRSRRHWRRGLSKRPTEPPRILDQGSSSSRGEVSPDKHPGLDIRPTWALFLPESLAFLMLCFVAGQDPRMLQYMV